MSNDKCDNFSDNFTKSKRNVSSCTTCDKDFRIKKLNRIICQPTSFVLSVTKSDEMGSVERDKHYCLALMTSSFTVDATKIQKSGKITLFRKRFQASSRLHSVDDFFGLAPNNAIFFCFLENSSQIPTFSIINDTCTPFLFIQFNFKCMFLIRDVCIVSVLLR